MTDPNKIEDELDALSGEALRLAADPGAVHPVGDVVMPRGDAGPTA